jgi:hypothetical protein
VENFPKNIKKIGKYYKNITKKLLTKDVFLRYNRYTDYFERRFLKKEFIK